MTLRPLLVCALTLTALRSATAQAPQLLGAQFTVIVQRLLPFASPYSGPNSLTGSGDTEGTHTYGVYFGSRVTQRLHAYVDLEMARGAGVGHAVGLAGITNGDVIRQGSVDLGQGPYIARAFLRYALPLGRGSDTASRAMDQLPGTVPASRLEIDVGKLAATDFFDQNRYANSARWQFSNWALFNNTAWDFAADTRGYTYGVAVSWVHPRWTLALGSFAMPRFANGNVFDGNVARARGDNVQLTWQPAHGPTIRILAYENHARMGDYAAALAQAQATGGAPDIVADDRPGRAKYGGALNLEQPLADSGETGAFLRMGWNDGHTEDFAFTEVDRHLSAGLQLTGARWRRAVDRFGIAGVLHGLSDGHRAYLAAGGKGFLLGDGRLNYGSEEILEAYYRAQIGPFAELGPDLQLIAHPGYNRDRGPASVITLRLNLRY